jgi:hypothetical protein
MSLLGELLLAKLVEHVELLGKGFVSLEPDGGQFDLHDDLPVGHHHTHTSEEYFQIFRELLSSGVTGVHGDEVTASKNEADRLGLVGEHELL